MSTSTSLTPFLPMSAPAALPTPNPPRSEEHTSELQSQSNLVCRLLLEKKKTKARLLAAFELVRLTPSPEFVPHRTAHAARYCYPLYRTQAAPRSRTIYAVSSPTGALSS